MAETSPHILLVIFVMAIATSLMRALPFFALRKQKDHPLLQYVGASLPPAVMLILVVYSLKETKISAPPYGLPELISVLVVAGLHLWKRKSLISIGVGTACYVALVQSRVLEILFGNNV